MAANKFNKMLGNQIELDDIDGVGCFEVGNRESHF